MTNSPNMGHARRVGTAASAPSTKEFEFLTCGLAKHAQHVQSDGIRGKRGRQGESVVDGVYDAGGPLSLEPRPDEWDHWLPRIMGAGTNPSYTLAETLPTFVVDVDKGADVFRYAGCKVNTASIVSRANTPLQLSMDIQALTEAAIGTFPNIAASLTFYQPYIHHNLVFTLASTTYTIDNVQVDINNALVQDRFLNSQTRTALPEGDRIITVSADFPFGDEIDSLYDLAVAGLAGSLVWSNGNFSLGLTFPKLQAPTTGPEIVSRSGEVFRRIVFQARRSGSSDEMAAANDSTP